MDKQNHRFAETKIQKAAMVIWQASHEGQDPISYSEFAQRMDMGNPHSREVAFSFRCRPGMVRKRRPAKLARAGRKKE